MTQIVKKNEKSKGQVTEQKEILNYDLPENLDLADQIDDLRRWIGGDKMEGSFTVPRFGLLSLKLRNTPMYCYDHPALMKLSKTAFTDGVHIFIAADFLKQLNKEEELSKGGEEGAAPLILHELMHMLMNHTRRLQQFPKDIANEAEDFSINAKLQIGFPEIKWVTSLREVGLSFKSGDVERYAKLAEETIARELMEKKSKNGQGQGQGQGKGQGQGQGQGQGKGQGQQGQGGQQQKGQGDGQGGQDQGDGQDDVGQNHTVPLEDLINALEEAGLQDVLDKLELPQSDDVEKIGKIEQQVRLKDIEAIQKAAGQKAKMGGKYPGAHIVDAAQEMVKGFTEGKLEWKLGLKNFMFGEGMRFRYSEMEAGDLYYVDPADMNLTTEIFVGQELPHKPEEVVLCMIDTSGSVDQNQIKAFLSEIFGLKRENAGNGDTASEVLVLYADTTLRGDILEITEENADEFFRNGVGVAGRGGTDLANDLRQAMKLPILEERKVASVVFFTDLCDTPPKKSDFPSNLPLCFVTLPSTMSEEFARAVKDFARVYPIEEGLEVDLTEDHLQNPVNTRKMKA